jgi:hypothetical protein
MTDDEVRTRLVLSKTTPLGVKHATFPQVVWYQEAITGTPRTRLGQPGAVDDSFAFTEVDTVDSVLAGYDHACATAREVGAMHGLDEVVNGHRMGDMTVRWIHLQVLRELAQHSGHADILRERLLADRTRTTARYGRPPPEPCRRRAKSVRPCRRTRSVRRCPAATLGRRTLTLA